MRAIMLRSHSQGFISLLLNIKLIQQCRQQCNNAGPRRLHDFASTLVKQWVSGCSRDQRCLLVSLMEYVCITQCWMVPCLETYVAIHKDISIQQLNIRLWQMSFFCGIIKCTVIIFCVVNHAHTITAAAAVAVVVALFEPGTTEEGSRADALTIAVSQC